MGLREIHAEFEWLSELLEQESLGTQDYEEIAHRIEALQGEEREKVDRWVYFLKTIDNRRDYLRQQKSEIEEILVRLNRIERASKEYLLYLNEREQLPNLLIGDLYRIRFQNSPISVEPDPDLDLSQLSQTHPHLVSEITHYHIDCNAVKAAHLAQESLPDGISVLRRRHIRIALNAELT